MAEAEAEAALNAEGNGVRQRMSDRSKVRRGFGGIFFLVFYKFGLDSTNFAPLSVFGID
jgi:hypothetical protein